MPRIARSPFALLSLLLVGFAGCSKSEPPAAEVFRQMGARAVDVKDGKLIELNLSQTKVADADLAQLAGSTDLIHLDLGLCDNITDAGLEHVAKLPELQTLTVDSNSKITDAGIAKLEPLKKLKILNIGQTKITNKAIDTVATLPALEKFSVALVKDITDEGVAKLDGLKHLDEIWLPETGVTPDGIKHLEEKHPNIVVHGTDADEPAAEAAPAGPAE